MAEVERDLEVIFDVMPTSEDLPSKLSAEKVYALCYHCISIVLHVYIMHISMPCINCYTSQTFNYKGIHFVF